MGTQVFEFESTLSYAVSALKYYEFDVKIDVRATNDENDPITHSYVTKRTGYSQSFTVTTTVPGFTDTVPGVIEVTGGFNAGDDIETDVDAINIHTVMQYDGDRLYTAQQIGQSIRIATNHLVTVYDDGTKAIIEILKEFPAGPAGVIANANITRAPTQLPQDIQDFINAVDGL